MLRKEEAVSAGARKTHNHAAALDDGRRLYRLADFVKRVKLEEMGFDLTGKPLADVIAMQRDLRAVMTGEFRAPKKGEWYISGAIPEAYLAPNDLASEYHIARVIRVLSTEIVSTRIST